MPDWKHLRVAILATNNFEEGEATQPGKALHVAGAKMDIIGPR